MLAPFTQPIAVYTGQDCTFVEVLAFDTTYLDAVTVNEIVCHPLALTYDPDDSI